MPAVPAVPAQHAQAIASAALTNWPLVIGLTVEHLAHHDQGPSGSVTFAVVRAKDPWLNPVLLRCDGYGHVTRGCEHPRADGEPCWHRSAPHLTIREPGVCTQHLPQLKVGDWVGHPDQAAYGRVTRVDPDGTIGVDYGHGEVTPHVIHVPRVPDHIATELDRSHPYPAPAAGSDGS